MADLYVVKSSPGKGFGVFASKAIQAGDVIMTDCVKMKLPRGKYDVTDEQIERAFNALTSEDQAAFMQLHEGHVQYTTRLMRIYKANAFSAEHHAIIYLKFSKLNHSCTPNAEMTELGNGQHTKLVAVKSITKDEEIFISYLGLLEEGSKIQRMQTLREGYGFECECAVCKLTGLEAALSDGRRQLVTAMAFKRQGLEPATMEFLSNLNGVTQSSVIGHYRQKLRVPLTTSEKVAYGFLTAKLLEAENFSSHTIPYAYIEAAANLLGQVNEVKFMVVLPSAKYVTEWTEAAVKAMKRIRKPDSKDYKDLKQFQKDIHTDSEHLRTAKAFVRIPNILSV